MKILRNSLIALSIAVNASPSFAQQVTVVCKSSWSSSNNLSPQEAADETFTFDLRENKVITGGDAYVLDSISPSNITWKEGSFKVSFNRDSLTGHALWQTGEVFSAFDYAPCKIMPHRF